MYAPRKCKDANKGQTIIRNRKDTALVKRKNKRNEDSDSSFSEEEEKEEVSRTKTSRSAREYKVTQINGNPRTNTGLDLVTLPIQEAKREKTSFLLDIGRHYLN